MADLEKKSERIKPSVLHNTNLSAEELVDILEDMQDTFYRTDNEGVLIYLSKSVDSLLGYKPEDALGTKMSDYYVDPDGREKFLIAFQESGGNIEGYEAPLRHKAGHVIWVSTNAHLYYGDDGEVLGVEGTTRDVTLRIKQQQELNQLKSTLDKTLDCVFMFNPMTLKFFYVNEGAVKQVGYSVEELLSMSPYDIQPSYTKGNYLEIVQPLIDGWESSLTFESIHLTKEGKELPVEIFLQYITLENEVPRFVAIVRDLSERLEVQEKLRHLAHHDSLTNLPNRLLFMDRLEHALVRRRETSQLAILFLDLDRFKIINDTLGHGCGDKILQMLSNRLSACVRKGDTLARLSGDEFAIVLEEAESTEDVVAVARHILEQLVAPFIVDERELFITTSIGISISPTDGDDSQTLLKHADIAMYRAKDLGRNTYQFYSSDMSSKAFERLNLETSLRYALEREQFKLAYQPQVDIESGKITGFEALLRWQHPDLGIVGPLDFIPILEETGLIVPVGEWVLNTACAQTKLWQEKFNPDLRIAINLSARQFNNSELVSKVIDALLMADLPADTLELEITESVLMQKQEWMSNAFELFKDMGVHIALDDFGTGYSSLSYLKRFPIDTIKIDRSFIRDVTEDADDAAIVSAIIAIAKSLQLDVVAEGVETNEQLEFVKEKGCSSMQGYLFSKPLMAEDMDELLSKQ